MTNTRLFLSSLGVFILCLICFFLFGGAYAACHFWRSGIHDNFGHVEHSYFESVSYLVSDFEVLTNHLWGGHLTVQVVDQVLQWGECSINYPSPILGLGLIRLLHFKCSEKMHSDLSVSFVVAHFWASALYESFVVTIFAHISSKTKGGI